MNIVIPQLYPDCHVTVSRDGWIIHHDTEELRVRVSKDRRTVKITMPPNRSVSVVSTKTLLNLLQSSLEPSDR